MERVNGGWSRVGWIGGVRLGGREVSFLIFGMRAVSVMWSLYYVSVAVVVARS